MRSIATLTRSRWCSAGTRTRWLLPLRRTSTRCSASARAWGELHGVVDNGHDAGDHGGGRDGSDASGHRGAHADAAGGERAEERCQHLLESVGTSGAITGDWGVLAGPTVSSVTANDPDDGDAVYGNADTITVVFSGNTNQVAAATKGNLDASSASARAWDELHGDVDNGHDAGDHGGGRDGSDASGHRGAYADAAGGQRAEERGQHLLESVGHLGCDSR